MTRRGITLLELLAVLSIMAILFGASLSSYLKLQRRQALGAAAEMTMDVFRQARRNAMDLCQKHYVAISPPTGPQCVTLFTLSKGVRTVLRSYALPVQAQLWEQSGAYPVTDDYVVFFVGSGEFSNDETDYYFTDQPARFGVTTDPACRRNAFEREDPALRMFHVSTNGFVTQRRDVILDD